jgi:hypothetical protein
LNERSVGEFGQSILRMVAAAPSPDLRLDRLVFKSGGTTRFIRVVDIDWIEAAGVYVNLHVAGKELLYRGALHEPSGGAWRSYRPSDMDERPAWSKWSGDKLMVRSRSKTDFWRTTFYGYITDNGHFFHLPASGNFTFQARVTGQYSALYDQAGLMVRLDAENWMKCGTEFFDRQRHASVVFTRNVSDWSTMPDLSNTGARLVAGGAGKGLA